MKSYMRARVIVNKTNDTNSYYIHCQKFAYDGNSWENQILKSITFSYYAFEMNLTGMMRKRIF